MPKKTRGFTLIELLVVIAIIGLLASVVLASLGTAKKKGQIAKLQEDAHGIETQIDLNRSKYVTSITGSTCTACSFSTTQTMKSQTGGIATNAAHWAALGFSSPPLDPWGNPYTIDENEGEFPTELCVYDIVYSGGPNGILEGLVSGGLGGGITSPDTIYAGVGDDYVFGLSFYSCSAPN